MQKAALILEGGAKRGVFTSGVLDYLMEQEYYIPHVIGVSAGSCNAVDYVSRQPGRTKACMIRSGEDGKIINFHNFFQTKSLLDMDLIFERDPKELHPFDFDTYFASDMTCEIVVTNCESGQAEYYSEKEDGDRLMQLCRASSSMPLVTPMVEIDGVPYLDGGIADSIPLIHSMRSGYRKNVLILTRSKGYRKTISKRDILMYQTVFKDYPNLARALCRRAHQYNEVMELVERWEEEGRIFVIRPQGKTVSRLESKPEVLEDFYQHGIEQMQCRISWKNNRENGTILTGSGMYCKDCKNMGEFMLVERFYPDEYLDSTYSIDFAELAKKGYRGVLFDIDNTLVPHGAPADERAKALFARLKAIGFRCCLISNNQKPRVEMFNKDIQVDYVYNAHKPSTRNYLRAMEIMGTDRRSSVFIGDQLFTDVWGAKRAGIPNILVKPIHPKEEIQIVLKRYLEKIVLHFYKKSQRHEKKVEK